MRKGIKTIPNFKYYEPIYYHKLDDYIKADGHSGGSFSWAMTQNKSIDEIGLNKWLKTEDAKGYSHYLNKVIFA